MVESKPDDNNLSQLQHPKTSLESSIEEKSVRKTSRLAIASAIFAIAIFVLSIYCLDGSYDIALAIVIFPVPVISLGIIALVRISSKQEKLKGGGYAISAIMVGLFLLAFVPAVIRAKESAGVVMCMSNLHQLGKAIIAYAEEHDGYLPSADKWCDLLLKHDKNLSKQLFKCPVVKHGICNYAFNKNLDSLRLVDVSDSVVLLYETDEGWNLNGGEELLKVRHKTGDKKRCNVLFTNGIVECLDISEQTLRWEP